MNSLSTRKQFDQAKTPGPSGMRRSAESRNNDCRTRNEKEVEPQTKEPLQAIFDDERDSSNQQRDVSNNGQREGMDDQTGVSGISESDGMKPFNFLFTCMEENLESGVNDANQVLKRLSELRESYKVVCDDQRNIIEQIMFELHELCETINSEDEQRAQWKREKDEVISNLEKCEEKMRQLQKENKDLRRAVESLEGTNQHLSSTNKKLVIEQDELTECYMESEEEIDECKRKEKQLQSSIQELNERLRKERVVTEEKTRLINENCKLLEEKMSLLQTIEDFRAKSELDAGTIRDLDAKIIKLAKEKVGLKVFLRNLKNHHDETLAELNREKDRIKSGLKIMYQRWRQLQLESDELLKELAGKEEENMRLRTMNHFMRESNWK